MTAEKFFQKYVRDQEKLKELEYRLARLDDDVIQISCFKHDKVQTTMQNRLDERVYNREEMREGLKFDIQWTAFEVQSAEMLMNQIGNRDGYCMIYLKRHYLDKHSINKIAKDFGCSNTKIKNVMKKTEELLCYLAK